MKTVAVFFGGNSNEREISVITGMYAVNLLRACGDAYRVLPVYLPPEGGFLLGESLRGVEDFRLGAPKGVQTVFLVRGGLAYEKKPKKRIRVDCALNCCHGGAGEGGVLSALLEWHKLPSASPSMAGSAVFLDKSLSKLVLRGLGIPTLPSFCVREERFASGGWREEARALGYPVIVKPAKLGSSVGIQVAQNEEELSAALKNAFGLDCAALVEAYLKDKRDLDLAAYRKGDEIVLSEVEEVFSDSAILTFAEKYEGAGRPSELPAKIPQETKERMGEMLTRVYEQFGMRGVVRADFLLSEEGLYFNELNTVPGTLAAHLFGGSLTKARELIEGLIEEALSRTDCEKPVVESGILSAPVFGSKTPKTADFQPKTP